MQIDVYPGDPVHFMVWCVLGLLITYSTDLHFYILNVFRIYFTVWINYKLHGNITHRTSHDVIFNFQSLLQCDVG